MPWAPTYIATKASSGTGARAGRVPFPISRSTPFVMRTTFDAGTPAASDAVADALGQRDDPVGAPVAEGLEAPRGGGRRALAHQAHRDRRLRPQVPHLEEEPGAAGPGERRRGGGRRQRGRRGHDHVRSRRARAGDGGPPGEGAVAGQARAHVAAVAGRGVGAPDVEAVLDLVHDPPAAVALRDGPLLVLDVGRDDRDLVARPRQGAGVLPVAHAARLVGAHEVLRHVEHPAHGDPPSSVSAALSGGRPSSEPSTSA